MESDALGTTPVVKKLFAFMALLWIVYTAIVFSHHIENKSCQFLRNDPTYNLLLQCILRK